MATGMQEFDAPTDTSDDVVVVTSASGRDDVPAHPEVMRALRYLIYRYELRTGITELPQMIAVVSAAGGEGVTTVSRALAEILASERSGRVCWIDFDAAERPARSAPPQRPELVDPSTPDRDDDSSTFVAHADASSIRLVPTGSLRAADIGTLPTRPAFEDLLDELSTGYRHVVFDTPPLSSRSDSIGFLRHADAFVLVTRHGSTTINQVRAITDELRSMPTLGIVLNHYRTRTPRFIRRFFTE